MHPRLSARRAVGVLAAHCLLIGGLGALGVLGVAGTANAAVAATCPPIPAQPPGQQDLPGLKLSGNALPGSSGLPCPDAAGGAGAAGPLSPDAITPRTAGAVSDVFNAVHATSASDVWAVGSTGSAVRTSTLAEHWDGSAWKVLPMPVIGDSSTFPALRGVTATSATDAWAVGSVSAGSGVTTLAEHWDGTAWSVVPTPSPGVFDGLSSVTAVSATNVWAVGLDEGSAGDDTLIEHWDGSSWSVVASPSPGFFNELFGVDARSATDVWAVGETLADNASSTQPLIEHWNGTSWTASTGDTAGAGLLVSGVAATSANNAWTVGAAIFPTNGVSTFIERWNGTAWKEVASP